MTLKTLMTATFSLMVSACLTACLTGCSSGGASYSVLSQQNLFSQNPTEVNGKVDILYVIDNSGSMATSQAHLRASFNSFISQFTAKGLDYQIAITTTDAYRPMLGDHSVSYSSVFKGVITPADLDPVARFNTLANVGTSGNGDERPLQSFQAALLNTANTLDTNGNQIFPRPGATLSIIMVGDEDDYANATLTVKQNSAYVGPYSGYPSGLIPVSTFVSFLDGITASTVSSKTYSVYSITEKDDACVAQLNSEAHQSYRYLDMAAQGNGAAYSLCDDFGPTLASISNSIIELTTKFFLASVPAPGTLQVSVNGVVVAQDSTNGYTYNSIDNSITFHGTGVPAAHAQITATFDPATI